MIGRFLIRTRRPGGPRLRSCKIPQAFCRGSRLLLEILDEVASDRASRTSVRSLSTIGCALAGRPNPTIRTAEIRCPPRAMSYFGHENRAASAATVEGLNLASQDPRKFPPLLAPGVRRRTKLARSASPPAVGIPTMFTFQVCSSLQNIFGIRNRAPSVRIDVDGMQPAHRP